MNKILFLLFLSISCGIHAQELQYLSVDQLNSVLDNKDGKIKVVNLWATWCAPCVAELPLFMNAKDDFKNQNLEFIFVSLDFQSQTKNVISKINELNLSGTMIQLNEKGNDWIEEFDKNWEGAIPYTILILPDKKRIYHYDNFETLSDLKSFITKNISN